MAFDFPASPSEGQMFAPSGGPLYVYEAPVWKVAGITTVPGEWVINEIVITATQTYNKPANLAYLEVLLLGAGGGGGYGRSSAGATSVGAGGAAGGLAQALLAAVDVPASATATIGAGGTPGTGATPVNAGTGGTTTFLGLSASGGLGGGAIATTAGPDATTGATGGVGSGGTVNTTGECGSGAIVISGSAAKASGGHGGSSPLGGGGRGVAAAVNGGNGGYGAGGGGTFSFGAATMNGGSGGGGIIILREYYPVWVLDAAAAPGTIRETVITTSGPYVKPAGLKFLEVEGVSGGGGAAQAINAAASMSAIASGGGAGAYGKRLFAASELAASTPCTIGAAGLGTATSIGGSGGTSEFGSGLNCTLSGGGGSSRSGSSASFQTIVGGGGGTAGTGWTVGVNGEAAHTTVGSVGNVLTANLRGRGGVSRFGWAAAEDTYAGSAASLSPGGYGCGAGGSTSYNQTGAQNGANGTQGMFIFREFF